MQYFDKFKAATRGELTNYVLPHEFKDLSKIWFQHWDKFNMPIFSGDVGKIAVPGGDFEKKSIIICMSGGAKSLATAFFYKDLGYDVELFHVYRTKDLKQIVKNLAEKLEIGALTVFDPAEHIDWNSPIHNIEIANLAIEYMLRHNMKCQIAFGCLSNCDIGSNSFKLYGGDTAQMWSAYEKIMKAMLWSDFSIKRPLPQSSYMWQILLKHPSYLDIIHTDKDVLYIIRADNGLLDKVDKRVYFACLGRIKKKYKKNTGMSLDSFQELWRVCFFYDMRKSVFYESLC